MPEVSDFRCQSKTMYAQIYQFLDPLLFPPPCLFSSPLFAQNNRNYVIYTIERTQVILEMTLES